jgi:hypothetical protein
MISNFLTVAALLEIAFTHTHHPPQKMDEKFCQTAELGFAKCNFQNLDKKYTAYGVRTKQLFLLSKAEMNFTQSMGFGEGLYHLYAITITLHIA